MEHPVPQNITSFEFHLVGDMTLKQFAYLAAGCAIAYLAFVFLLPANLFMAIPIIILSATLGAAFAFIPIVDRPLDHWAKAFLTAVYSPTRGRWAGPTASSKESNILQDPIFKNRLQIYLSSLGVIPTQPLPSSISQNSWPIPPATSPSVSMSPFPAHPPPFLPTSAELDQLVRMAEQIQVLRTKITEIEQQIDVLKNSLVNAANPAIPKEQVQEFSGKLQNLIKQTEEIYHKTAAIKKEEVPRLSPTKVVIIEPPKPKPTLQVLTSVANVINGVVVDEKDNVIEGVIVIIHNKDGIPVRALKTNKLGQFTGATGLPSGVYTVTLEREGLEFDTLQVTLTGEIMPSLKIFPKRENND